MLYRSILPNTQGNAGTKSVQFLSIKAERTLPNLLHEASSTIITKPVKNITFKKGKL